MNTLIRVAFAMLTVGLAGCSSMPTMYSTAWGPDGDTGAPPLVQNCGIVGIGSPTKYACNGKVYTSFQLTKLRQQWQQKQTAQAGPTTRTTVR